jgi:putative Holliday junction resolvase
MRILAIDYGSKAIGLAISDELQLTVRPLTTIRRERRKFEEVLESICKAIADHEPGTVLVGLPLNMDGSHGEAARKAENFAARLQPRLSVPIIMVDERLSSYEADQMLREMSFDLRQRKARSDEYAALIILQDYLETLKRNPPADSQ